MTTIRAVITVLMIGALLAVPARLGAQPTPPHHQGGGVQHGYGPPAPHGGGQWPAVEHRPASPPPRHERAPHPRPGHYWVPGHYAWRGSWVWAPGLWVTLQPNCGWVPPHWQWYPYGWVWLEGYWAC
jgi:hypothetical protein